MRSSIFEGANTCNGLFTLLDQDSDSDSNLIPVIGSWEWNLNLTPYSVNGPAWYTVGIILQFEMELESGPGKCKQTVHRHSTWEDRKLRSQET